MKHILRLTTTLALVLGIAATGFAVVDPVTNLNPVAAAEKQTSTRKHSKHRRHHRGKKMGNRRRASSSARRGYRLTNRQRRYWNQKLLDIYLN